MKRTNRLKMFEDPQAAVTVNVQEEEGGQCIQSRLMVGKRDG